MALIAASIERYKYYKQVKTNNLDHLTKARNYSLVFKEEAKSMIVGLEKRLQLLEEGRLSLAKKTIEQEADIESLVARLWDSEAEITHGRNDLGVERNRYIKVEAELKVAVESTRKKAKEETSAWVRLELRLEREKERREEAS